MTHVFNAGVDYPGLGLCNILGRCGFAVQVKNCYSSWYLFTIFIIFER